MRQAILLTFLFLFLSSTSFAAVYKWTNEQGVTTYSQHPPANRSVDSKKVTIKYGSQTKETDQSPSFEKSAKAIEKSNAKRAADVASKKQAMAEQQKLKQRCSSARKNLNSLDFGGNRLYKNAEGKYQRFDEEDKKQKRQQIREFLKEFCK